MEEPVRIRILDHEYLIRSEEDQQQVQRVAQYVDESFRKVKNNAGGLSETKTAILAAFHIAGEYFQALNEQEDLRTKIQKRIQALNTRIDSVYK